MIPLVKGSFGDSVLTLQKALQKKGYKIDADSKFGDNTLKAVIDYQTKVGLEPDGIVGEMTMNSLLFDAIVDTKKDALKCVKSVYQVNDYYKSINKKNQICLHHTAGGPSPYLTVDWWRLDPAPVATAFVIGGSFNKNDGEIIQAHPDQYWAWHLGIDPKFSGGCVDRTLDSKCIGIEICNWGFLRPSNADYVSYANVLVRANNATVLDTEIRGQKVFQKYTDAQIESTRILLIELANKHNINIKGNYDRKWFELSKDALSGKEGLFNHCNYRTDKIDIFPQPEMLDMLNSL